MASLNDIPFLSGYMQMDQVNRGREGQQLQQAAQFQTLQGAMEQTKARQVAAQREAQFRQRMAGARTDEERAQIAMEAEGAKGVLSHLDRKEARRTTNEATLARLSQQAQQFDLRYQMDLGKVKSAEEKAQLDAWYKSSRLALDEAALRMTGERLSYDTGAKVGVPQSGMPPMQGIPPVGAAPSAPVTYSFNTPNGPVSGNAANVNGALGAIGQQEVTASPAAAVASAALPQQAPMPAAPIAAAPMQPAMPNNMDARDLRLQQGAPVASPAAAQAVAQQPGQGVPGVRSAYADMPKFSGSPRDVARAQNEWLSDKAKADQKSAVAGSKIGVNIAGGRESVFINRVVNSGSQAAADLKNVVALPMSSGRGLFGGRSQGKSLLEAAKESLTTKMTEQEVQSYNVVATGFQRALAAIEGMGLAPTNALMHQMDGVIFKEGDTNMTKLLKLAQTRQIIDKGLEVIVANPRVDEETKKLVRKTLDDINSSVPFTPSEVLQLEGLHATNPNATMRDVMNKKKAETQGAWDASKEKRLQELKAQLGK